MKTKMYMHQNDNNSLFAISKYSTSKITTTDIEITMKNIITIKCEGQVILEHSFTTITYMTYYLSHKRLNDIPMIM